MKKVSVTLTWSLPISIKEKPGFKYLVSYCPVLDVWSQGKTEKEAEANLKEAIQLFLTNCFERGTVDKVLKSCGFIAAKRHKAQKLTPPMHEIEVLLPFIIDEQLARCHD